MIIRMNVRGNVAVTAVPTAASTSPTATPTASTAITIARLHASGTTTPHKRTTQWQTQLNQQQKKVANFAITTYQAVQGLIDYTTSDGRKHFKEATNKLNQHGFDCQVDNLR